MAGCSAPERPTSELELTVSDSGGLKVVEIRQPLDFRTFQPVAEARTDLTLGVIEDGFGHIADVAGFADGRIAVLDRTELRVVQYDAAAKMIRQFGRKGAGPGEFADPIGLALFGDSADHSRLENAGVVRCGRRVMGWPAKSHGDSSTILVNSLKGDPLAIVRLPVERNAITLEDRKAFADWFYKEDILKNTPASWHEVVERYSRRTFHKMVIEAMRWATLAPTTTALYGDRQYLWIAGFAPNDYSTGRSLTWLGVNIETRQTRTIRLPRTGARVRDFAGGYVYTTYQDFDGIMGLERHPAACN